MLFKIAKMLTSSENKMARETCCDNVLTFSFLIQSQILWRFLFLLVSASLLVVEDSGLKELGPVDQGGEGDDGREASKQPPFG